MSASVVYPKIRALQCSVKPRERFAGIELEIALRLLTNEANLLVPDNDFWQIKCRTLLLRPAMEAIAFAYWNPLAQAKFAESKAVHIACLLAGKRILMRDKPIFGEARRGDVEFEELAQAKTWLRDIFQASNDPVFQPILPAYCFARVIMAHPFSDGNGRFARYMIHAALASSSTISAPAVALAPAFYRRANTLSASLGTLSEHGDWNNYFVTFFSVLDEAVEMTREYLVNVCGAVAATQH